MVPRGVHLHQNWLDCLFSLLVAGLCGRDYATGLWGQISFLWGRNSEAKNKVWFHDYSFCQLWRPGNVSMVCEEPFATLLSKVQLKNTVTALDVSGCSLGTCKVSKLGEWVRQLNTSLLQAELNEHFQAAGCRRSRRELPALHLHPVRVGTAQELRSPSQGPCRIVVGLSGSSCILMFCHGAQDHPNDVFTKLSACSFISLKWVTSPFVSDRDNHHFNYLFP